MSVSYVSSSVSGTSDSSGTSKSIPVPTGAAAGIIALICMEMWWSNSVPTITWPSGFTQFIGYQSTTDGSEKIYVAWKRLTGVDSGSYSITWNNSQWNMGHCMFIGGGIASGDPIEATNVATGASGTTIPSVSVTTASTDPFLAHFSCSYNVASGTPPSGFTEVQDGDYLKSSYRIPGAAGTYTASGGTTSASTVSLAALIAVKPDGAASPSVFEGWGMPV